ncbi:YesN/AraC family two-component response regulator [Paenibacillus endophyticus]|uniref:YesN/AraC family two-component response regulator n=1 Tax=Paenibacillus endophyticus TaxID=1294268 RepID=A0A7W5CDK5_9BACL|nr:response regulator [Paenibacillus endophyticus]MBB3155748.1 YesN/AraC family two-component response regulator [Paenibacillus endophyticus]
MKVLIVDDEPLILNGIVKIVNESMPLGMEVRAASSVPEALDVMKAYLPDVTVTDLHMPEKNGFDLIEEARESGLCDRFIILTGYEYFEYARRALRAGVVDYLMKPVDRDEIADLLKRIAEELPIESDSSGYAIHAQRILAYLDKHYMQDLSLEHLAGLMDLHPHYISRLFKKETGENFVNYLNGLRIREAKKLLNHQQHLTVNAIGQRVGFESSHYFSKVFKKFTGVTPGAYREDRT